MSSHQTRESIISEAAAHTTGGTSQRCDRAGRIAQLVHPQATELKRRYPRASIPRPLLQETLVQLCSARRVPEIPLRPRFRKKIALGRLVR